MAGSCLAEMTGIDLSAEVERKLARNVAREYRPDDRGVLRRVADPGRAGLITLPAAQAGHSAGYPRLRRKACASLSRLGVPRPVPTL